MVVRHVLEHLQLHPAQRFTSALTASQILVVADHEIARVAIRNRPQTHHLTFCSSQNQRASEAIDAFAVPNLAEPSVAGGKDDQLGAPKVQTRSFERR